MKKTKLCLIALLIAIILTLTLTTAADEETKTIKSSKSFVRKINEGTAVEDNHERVMYIQTPATAKVKNSLH